MKYYFIIPILLFSNYCFAQKYWQQQVDVKIDVKLDDITNFLSGFETINYTNNSPDTLHYIFLHLWPNAYKHDHTPLAKQLDQNHSTAFYYSKAQDKGYIEGLSFKIDEQNVDFLNTEDVPDIARIDLNKALLPGGKLTITTPFRVKIPKVFSRMGHTGQAYYISQWFPKPAVYDRKGWHPISYLDQGEFYSDYGTYDVSITLPRNYIVMATGNCTDKTENSWLDSLAALPYPSDTLYEDRFPASDPILKTIHFHEEKVHDFAWFADKRWIVRKDTVVSPGNSELVTTWAAFLPQHKMKWMKATDYLKETIKSYGSNVGPYPYKTVKAAEGDLRAGGGMEYPTVTIIDKSALTQLRTTVVHEAGHNWVYGMLGTMERNHAWMDEGINTFYEQKTTSSNDSSEKKTNNLIYTILFENMQIGEDQAIEQTSANFTTTNYGLDVYYKTAMSLRWLEQYMGPTDFRYAMQDYFNTWKFKHPYPEDLQAMLQKHTRKNIDWFFTDALSTDKKIDFSIKKITHHDGNTEITVHSKNNLDAPVIIDVYKNDSLLTKIASDPFRNSTTLSLPASYDSWTQLKVDNAIPDAKTANNTYRRKLSLPFFDGKLFVGQNRNDKETIFLSPAAGYNIYDGFQAGLLIHNLTLPENRFRFALMPTYAFNSKSFTGAASVGYAWYPENLFKEVLLQVDAKSYHFNEFSQAPYSTLQLRYTKIAPSLNIKFNEHNLLSPVTRTLTLKAYNITEDAITYLPVGQGEASLKQQQNNYGLIRYTHRNDRTYNPFSYSGEGQIGADFAKINLTGNARVDYNKPGKALSVRAYIGKFFSLNSDPALTERYYLATSYSGTNDYLYDGTYMGRNDINGRAAQQISLQEGGFKIPVHGNVGQSDNWLATLNLLSDLPIRKLPIRLFLDAGLSPNPSPSVNNPNETKFLYDAGLEIYIVKNVAAFYIPLVMSGDFRDYLTATYGSKNVFLRSITFYIQLQNLNWLKAPARIVKLSTGG